MCARQMPKLRITLLFVGTLAVLLSGCTSPIPEQQALFVRTVEGNVFDTTAVRGEYKPLRNRRTNFEYKCSECHEDFTSLRRQQDLPGEHAAIYDAFNHGINNSCLNCHNQSDRDAYINHDGSSIPATAPALLCAKCHGPIYNDWTEGIHGRQNGHWDTDKGPRTKLLCVQCHDPHNPTFQAMTPDPPPPHSRFSSERSDHASSATGEAL